MPNTESTNDKIAVVTGASSGIGRHTAIRIAERGAGVILTYNTNPDGAEETVATIEDRGGTAVALRLDVGGSETFDAFAQRVAAELADRWQRTSFDYLVNNAGFGQMSMFADTTEELYDRFHRVILKGPYFLTQRLLPLLADGGAIVNTTSNSALPTGLEAGYSAYATMKGGLAVLTRYLAKELSVRGIRVNSVAPGPTRTRLSPTMRSSASPRSSPRSSRAPRSGAWATATTSARSSPPCCRTSAGGSPERTSKRPAASTCSDVDGDTGIAGGLLTPAGGRDVPETGSRSARRSSPRDRATPARRSARCPPATGTRPRR